MIAFRRPRISVAALPGLVLILLTCWGCRDSPTGTGAAEPPSVLTYGKFGGGIGELTETVMAVVSFEITPSSGTPVFVFQDLEVTPITERITFPGNRNPDFVKVKQLLTNGVMDRCRLTVTYYDARGNRQGELSVAARENGFFKNNEPTPLNPDLAGCDIANVSLVVDDFTVEPDRTISERWDVTFMSRLVVEGYSR